MSKIKIIFVVVIQFVLNYSFGQSNQNIDIISNPVSDQEKLLLHRVTTNENDVLAYFDLAWILSRKAYYYRAAINLNIDTTRNHLLFANVINAADSALLFFSKATGLLNPTVVKNNVQHFQDYQRRDIRTGEYTIKYEDVIYDIERKKGQISALLLEACRGSSNLLNNNWVPVAKQELSGNTKNIDLKGKYYALIIGVSDYQNYKLNLYRPSLDAQKLHTIITTTYSFENENVTLLLNPTRQEILTSLYNLRRQLNKEDNLLIFYAGHGMYDEEAGQGYWWPKDADSENPSNWLSNSDLRDQIRGIKALHILLIADACFSGGIFRTRSAEKIQTADIDIISLYKLPSRRAITSGTLTTVPDNSVFFDYLCKSLETNSNQFLGSQVLFNSFRLNVINNTFQVPQEGVISETGDEGGDFIFIRKH
ncbi:MAG: caspase family protein [Cyclobacteriaceae bacterium]|jgi:hypothetical protein|nr:caspase family protein [Cyclobacteriaceae bacterium]